MEYSGRGGRYRRGQKDRFLSIIVDHMYKLLQTFYYISKSWVPDLESEEDFPKVIKQNTEPEDVACIDVFFEPVPAVCRVVQVHFLGH